MGNVFADSVFKLGTKIAIKTVSGYRYQGVIESVNDDSVVLLMDSKRITLGEDILDNLLSIELLSMGNKINFFAPFQKTATKGMLPPMGRIMYIGNKYGRIADVASQKTLFFYRNSILEDYLYNSNNTDLVGTDVLYSVKTMRDDEYEARSIIRPMTYTNALSIASSIESNFPLDALALLQTVEKFYPYEEIKNRIALLQRRPATKKMWKMVDLQMCEKKGKEEITKEDKCIRANSFVVSYSGQRGMILCEEDYYPFTNAEIIEDHFVNLLKSFNYRNIKHRQIPVCCILDKDSKKTICVFRPMKINVLINFVGQKVRARDFIIAQAIVNYALNDLPNDYRLRQLDQEISESLEQICENKSNLENSLAPCGYIFNKPPKKNLKFRNESAQYARIKDSFCTKNVVY
ncbi:MAG: hypothetical protein KBT09_04885, partial [Bacteroidales bacterium]|nr:hypothetical protein [Candidatus Sodaliphilus fimicaballi]